MKFLFRAPLLDIDPQDENEIMENWDLIRKIISVSSPSLFQEISSTNYKSLHPKIRKKVYKYILRGRYRSTPFGLLAAVGLGDFNENVNHTIDLRNVVSISQASFELISDLAGKRIFYLAEGGFEKLEKLHFLIYSSQIGRWCMADIPKNKTFEFILNQKKETKSIDFEQFKKWFEDPSTDLTVEIWNKMVELGIFYSIENLTASKTYQKEATNLVFEDELSLPSSILNEIRDFYQQAGGLYCKGENQFLLALRLWFTDIFDDRYVPLSLLIRHDDFINKVFFKRQSGSSKMKMGAEFTFDLSTLKSLDLKPIFPHKPLDSGIYDFQLAIKTGVESSTIVLENAVCNRPFVYFGRFNHEKKLYCHQEKTKDLIYKSKEVLYAELRLIESANVASICDTQQVFYHYITPIHDSNPKAISIDEIEIGLNGSEFQLIHKSSLKKIVPVVVHPLNGEEISHPVMRLLWEIAHQEPFEFFPYALRKQKSITYLPQFNWGTMVLQTRRWVIEYLSFSSSGELSRWLEKNTIPNPIVMGYLDRELVLHWRLKIDLEILWSELRKWKRLVLSDPIWLKGSLFRSQNNRPIYPQCIVQFSRRKDELSVPEFVNSVEYEARDCLYILFRIEEGIIQEFLDCFFIERLLGFLREQRIIWYFLVYPGKDHLQVRIRFLNLNENQKTLLLNVISEISAQKFLSYEFRPYFPEQKKYGRKEYIKSEQGFYLESRLLIEGFSDKENNRLINCIQLKLELIIKLWTGVILKIQSEEYYFEFLKRKVKSIPYSEIKYYRTYTDLIISDSEALNEFQDWISSYREIILSHSRLKGEKKVALVMIQNHIHMQVNRFFPSERKKMEGLVHFLIYRKLGDFLYRNPKKQKVHKVND